MGDALHAIGSGEEWTAEQFTRMLDLYEKVLDRMGYEPVPYPDATAHVGGSLLTATRFDCLNHAFWMCRCVRQYVRENRIARAYRWMGMIQGLLFMGGVYSLEELSDMERRMPAPSARRGAGDMFNGGRERSKE
jgi:hypothetical protein